MKKTAAAPGKTRKRGHAVSHFAGPLLAAALLSLGTGCSQGRLGMTPHNGNQRLDVLTSFTLAVSRRDFKSAVNLMSPGEQTRFLDQNGNFKPEYASRLEALQLDDMDHNPDVVVKDGKISGIGSMLPVALEGPPITPQEVKTSEAAASADSFVTAGPARVQKSDQLHRTAEEFFRSIHDKNWERALSYVDPEERKDFLDTKGEVKSDAKQRLGQVDTSSWSSLSLRDGKLTGIVLIIPPPPPPPSDSP